MVILNHQYEAIYSVVTDERDNVRVFKFVCDCGFFISAFFFMGSLFRTSITEIIHNTLQQYTQIASGVFSRTFDRYVLIAEQFANEPSLVFAVNRKIENDQAANRTLVSGKVNFNFEETYLFLNNHKVLVQNTRDTSILLSETFKTQLDRTLKFNTPVLFMRDSAVYNAKVLYIMTPVRGKTQDGIFVLGKIFDNAQLKILEPFTNRGIFLFSEKGRVSVSNHEPKLFNVLLASTNLSKRIREISEGDQIIQEFNETRFTGILTIVPFRYKSFYLGSIGFYVQTKAFRDIEKTILHIGFFTLAFIGFFFIMILILNTRFIIRPIRLLASGFDALACGNLEVRIPLLGLTDLVKISAGFNAATERIKISMENLMEAERNASKRAEELAAQLLQSQKMELLGKLSGGIAHDFNNLLGGILGFADKLQEEFKNNPKAHRSLQNIIRSGERAAQLVQKLLGMARKGQYEIRVLNINALVLETKEIMYRTIDKTITIKTDLAQNLWNIEGDSNQIIQVLMNLGINARDAMPAGGEIWFETQNIEANETYCKVHKHLIPGRYVRISVLDTGVGIPKDQLDKIFDPYFTTKEIGKGTGLGLAMVYGIVQNHKGHITVYSEEGKGSVFHVYFPSILEDVSLQLEDITSKQTTPDLIDDHIGKTILVVDDEEIMRELAQELLLDSDVTLHFATNGEEAITIYQQHRQEIDLVILDIIMPKMDGFKTFHQLRKDNPNLKIIFSSGYAETDAIKSLRTLGNVGFIQKPYVKATLISCIRALAV